MPVLLGGTRDRVFCAERDAIHWRITAVLDFNSVAAAQALGPRWRPNLLWCMFTAVL
jgi:hypothetical protein